MYESSGLRGLRRLVGHQVANAELTEDKLTFTTTTGLRFVFAVEGDCCSYSYFHDIQGVDKFTNGPITDVAEVDLDATDAVPAQYQECVEVYGYSLTTTHQVWGPQTIVFSFRNESNGYYGGSMHLAQDPTAVTETV